MRARKYHIRPEIVSRGFVYVKESEELISDAKSWHKGSENCKKKYTRVWLNKNSLKDELNNYIYMKTKRSPMILPIIMEI